MLTENDIREINGLLARFHDKSKILNLSFDERFKIELALLKLGVKVDNPLDPTPNCPPGGTNVALRVAT